MKLFKIFFFIIQFSWFSSCINFAFYEIDKIFDKKEITFLGLELEHKKTANENFGLSKNIENYAQYPSLTFREKTFFSAWLDVFISNPLPVKVNFLNSDETKKILDLGGIPEFLYSNKNVILNLNQGNKLAKIFNTLDKDYYLIAGFTDEPWQQGAKGYIKLFDRSKRLIWFQNFNLTSNYIVYDKNSPFLIYNNLIRVKPNQTTYTAEIKKIYHDLGKSSGQLIVDKLEEIYNQKKR